MATIKLCDRCGKTFNYNCFSGTPNAINIFKRNINRTRITEGTEYDLCPECISKLDQFLANEDIFEPVRQKVQNAYNALLADKPDVDAATGYLGEVLGG